MVSDSYRFALATITQINLLRLENKDRNIVRK